MVYRELLLFQCILSVCPYPFEPRHEKTGCLHMRKQRRRSASRYEDRRPFSQNEAYLFRNFRKIFGHKKFAVITPKFEQTNSTSREMLNKNAE